MPEGAPPQPLQKTQFIKRRFKSEVQQWGIDGMAE
jgi:hypothetical protein